MPRRLPTCRAVDQNHLVRELHGLVSLDALGNRLGDELGVETVGEAGEERLARLDAVDEIAHGVDAKAGETPAVVLHEADVGGVALLAVEEFDTATLGVDTDERVLAHDVRAGIVGLGKAVGNDPGVLDRPGATVFKLEHGGHGVVGVDAHGLEQALVAARVDLGDLAAHVPADEVVAMSAQEVHGAGGMRPVEPVGGDVDDVVHAHVAAQRSAGALFGELVLHGDGRGVPALVVVDHHAHAGLLGGIDDLVRIGRRSGQRLLDQHVLAVLDGGEDRVLVIGIGGGNRDSVDVFGGEQLVKIGICLDAILGLDLLADLLGKIADSHKLGTRIPRVTVEMVSTVDTGSDNGDLQLVVHTNSLRLTTERVTIIRTLVGKFRNLVSRCNKISVNGLFAAVSALFGSREAGSAILPAVYHACELVKRTHVSNGCGVEEKEKAGGVVNLLHL